MKLLALKLYFISIFLINLDTYAEDITLLSDGDLPGEIEKRGKNEIVGIGGRIVTEALKAKNITYKISLKNWKRTYTEALANEDKKSFVIPLTRNKERETKFVWAARIYDAKAIFLSLKGQKSIDSIKETKGLKIGVLFGSSYENILINPENKIDVNMIDPSPNEETSFKKLVNKKIDAWFTTDIASFSIVKSNSKFENLSEKDFYFGKEIAIQEKYIGTTSATPKELIKKVAEAIESFKKTPEYKKIINKK